MLFLGVPELALFGLRISAEEGSSDARWRKIRNNMHVYVARYEECTKTVAKAKSAQPTMEERLLTNLTDGKRMGP